MQRHLVIMLKAPRIGRAKTRLARSVGGAEAMRLYRAMSDELIRRLARDPRWRTYLAVSPDDWRPEATFGGRMPCVLAQGSGNLGQRMQRVMDRLPPGPVAIIGSDIPAISPGHIEMAFAELGRFDAVVGPAGDGGYWLIGQKRQPKTARLFAGVRWSTKWARRDTLVNLQAQGMRYALLDRLDDVDNVEDLVAMAGQGTGNWFRRVNSLKSAAI